MATDLVLDERKTAILNAIVQAYVRAGVPVGSQRLVEDWDLGVSAATVRAEMAALEDAGFITQPHTSAGRVPTDKGYRHYVDSLTEAATLTPEQRQALETLMGEATDLEELLRRASGVLSRLTHFAGLVVAPRLDRSRLRHVELVQLGPTSVLTIAIADTGRVDKRMLDLDTPVTEDDLQRARHALNEAATGLRLDQVPDVLTGLSVGAPPELTGLIDAVAEAVRAGVGERSGGNPVYVGGTANIVGGGAFDRLEQVKQVYETLEEHVVVLQMLRDALQAGDPAVRIGHELPLVELAACSVVAASYEAPGEVAGSVGVLGPMRMDYPWTLAAVQAVASSLEHAIAELTGSKA